jgi:predicted transcriptional regulator
LSDRDIVVRVVAPDVPPDAATVGDVMSHGLLVARETDDLLDTIKLMQRRRVRRTPMVNDAGVLCGIAAVDDVTELIAEQLNDLVALGRVE